MIPIPKHIRNYPPHSRADREAYARWMSENVRFYNPIDYDQPRFPTGTPKNVLWPLAAMFPRRATTFFESSLEKSGLAEKTAWWYWAVSSPSKRGRQTNRYIVRLRNRTGVEVIAMKSAVLGRTWTWSNHKAYNFDIILPASLEIFHGKSVDDVLEKIRILTYPFRELPLLLAEYHERQDKSFITYPEWLDLIERRLKS